MKPYLQIRWDRIYGDDMLQTHRCSKCHVAVVESRDGKTVLDARYRGTDEQGNMTALVHSCASAKRQRKLKKDNLWD